MNFLTSIVQIFICLKKKKKRKKKSEMNIALKFKEYLRYLPCIELVVIIMMDFNQLQSRIPHMVAHIILINVINSIIIITTGNT